MFTCAWLLNYNCGFSWFVASVIGFEAAFHDRPCFQRPCYQLLNERSAACFRQMPVSFKCLIHCFSLCCFSVLYKKQCLLLTLFLSLWNVSNPPSPTRWCQLKLSARSASFRLFFFVTFLSCFVSLMVESRIWTNNSYFFPLLSKLPLFHFQNSLTSLVSNSECSSSKLSVVNVWYL